MQDHGFLWKSQKLHSPFSSEHEGCCAWKTSASRQGLFLSIFGWIIRTSWARKRPKSFGFGAAPTHLQLQHIISLRDRTACGGGGSVTVRPKVTCTTRNTWKDQHDRDSTGLHLHLNWHISSTSFTSNIKNKANWESGMLPMIPVERHVHVQEAPNPTTWTVNAKICSREGVRVWCEGKSMTQTWLCLLGNNIRAHYKANASLASTHKSRIGTTWLSLSLSICTSFSFRQLHRQPCGHFDSEWAHLNPV